MAEGYNPHQLKPDDNDKTHSNSYDDEELCMNEQSEEGTADVDVDDES